MADEPDELDLEDDPEPTPLAEPDEPELDEVEDKGEPEPQAAGAQDRPTVEAPAEPRQPSRSERRIQSQQDENRRLNTELAETRRRLDELARRMEQPRQPVKSAEQRAARHAMMAPQDIMAEQLRESEARMTQFMHSAAVTNADTMDRTAFQAKAAVDPLYAKWAPKVEGKLAEERTKGNNLEREVLLKYMIGEAALERRNSKEGRAEVRQAERRVNAQRARPVNSGSDTQAQRRQPAGLERRLENVQI